MSTLDGIIASGGGNSGGSGDVVGPASATDFGIAYFDDTTGKLLASSAATITAAGSLTIPSAETIEFSTDTGLARSAAGVVKITDGSSSYGSVETLGVYINGAASSPNTTSITTPGLGIAYFGGYNGAVRVRTGGGFSFGNSENVAAIDSYGLSLADNSTIGWTSGHGINALNPPTFDTGLARSAAGVVKVTDGSTGGGRILVANGSGTDLALAFVSDTNTGLYGDGADALAFVAGGNRAFYINGSNLFLEKELKATAGITATDGVSKLNGFLFLVEANTAGSGSPNIISGTESRTVFTNEGSSAKNYETLPSAGAGYQFTFVVQDADGMRIVANTDDTIRVIDKVTAAAGYIESTTIGSVVTLIAINATEWIATSIHGTWTDGTFTYDDTSLTTP